MRRFWAGVGKRSFDVCWPFRNGKWYGQIQHEGELVRTHRLSWIIHNGEIPPRGCICHKCDNPPCSNPTHLFLGSYRDNIMDARAKGRMVTTEACIRRGEANNKAKLTAAKVTEIRALYATATRNQVQLASDYSVTQAAIWAVLNRKTWKHVQ
jgi:hypothetical protein